MSNRYGISLGKIMQTTSALKTAKLRRNKMQKDADRENLEDEAYGAFIEKDSPKNMIAAADDNQDGIIDDEEKLSAKRKTGMKYNALSKIENLTEKRKDRKQTRSIRASADERAAGRYKMDKEKHDKQVLKNEKFSKSLEKIALANGSTPEEAKLIGEGGIKQVAKTTKFVNSANDKQIDGLVMMNHSMIKEATGLGELATQDPQAAEQKYQGFMKDIDTSILDAAKSGNKKQLELLEDTKSSLPQSLMRNGQFDFKGLNVVMAKAQNNIDNIQTVRRLNSSSKEKSTDPTYSQVKTHLREVRKQAQSVLARDVDRDTKEELEKKDKVIEDAVRIAKDNPSLTVEEAIGQAKGGKSRNAIKTATKKSGKIKEGSTSTSKGKAIIYKNGKWVYK